jgi:hypothetical protein
MGKCQRNRARWCGLESSDSGRNPVVVSCEHGNEPLGGKFLHQTRDYLPVNDSATWTWLLGMLQLNRAGQSQD